ncbi:MAG: glycosyltransferase family 4 protein [Candidatus Rokuibacteriota bacterium]|nr:MAG: glycosyltransferase family 4 protein [Candidatus Rokubacteria bacterium]
MDKNREMRVALFTNNYLPFRGGVTTAVETLRQELCALHHQAWVFAPASRRVLADPPWVFRYPSIPAPTYPGFALALPFSRRLYRIARTLSPDIVHAHHPFLLGPTSRRFARRHRRPLVFTYHTRYEKYAHYVPLPERFVGALAVRLSCRFAGEADLVVAPSSRIAATLCARGVAAPIAVIPTGVPLDLFRPGDRTRARRALGLPDSVPLCLYVGRLDREKSVDRVINAFRSVADAISGATLWLVGQGTHEAALRRLAQASPASDRIHFQGGMPRESLPAFYRAADLFVFASETETQGLVLAEAHGCGLPAVAVRAPGVDEVVRDGETGLLTKADARELADAAIGLLLDGERRIGMGRAARSVVERDFSAARQVEAMVGHYDRLLAQGR